MDGWSSVLRPRQHSIGYMADGFYRSKDPTNSIKALKLEQPSVFDFVVNVEIFVLNFEIKCQNYIVLSLLLLVIWRLSSDGPYTICGPILS